MEQVKGLWRSVLLPGLLGVVIGCAVGGVDAVFGVVLLRLSAVRDAHVLPLLLLLPLGGVLIAWVYRTVGRGTEQGMGLVFEAGQGEAAEIPLRLIPLIMGGTWLTHLLGGSAGREGVAVQIGAAVGHGVGRRTGGNGKVFLIAGMAAGFSGLFRTPIAAVFFALEVMTAGALEYAALFPAMTASFAACAVSGALGLEKFQAAVSAPAGLNAGGAAVLLSAGVLFGVTGGLFARALAATKGWAAKALPNPLARITALGGAAALLLLLCGRGRYAGLGTISSPRPPAGGPSSGLTFF